MGAPVSSGPVAALGLTAARESDRRVRERRGRGQRVGHLGNARAGGGCRVGSISGRPGARQVPWPGGR